MAEKKQWHETLHDQFGQYFAVDNVLYHEKTDHQDLIIFENAAFGRVMALDGVCLLYTSPSPRDRTRSRMPSSA